MSLNEIFLNPKGESLEKWLKENKAKIRGKRILYVLKPNMESNVIKFGIAGEYASINEDASFERLKSYLTTYGREEDCKTREKKKNCNYGVTVYAIYGNNYNRNVEPKNTAVHKKELYLKRELSNSITRVGRGTERTDERLSKILKLVADNRFTVDEVTDVSLKRSKRLKYIVAKKIS